MNTTKIYLTKSCCTWSASPFESIPGTNRTKKNNSTQILFSTLLKMLWKAIASVRILFLLASNNTIQLQPSRNPSPNVVYFQGFSQITQSLSRCKKKENGCFRANSSRESKIVDIGNKLESGVKTCFVNPALEYLVKETEVRDKKRKSKLCRSLRTLYIKEKSKHVF